MEEIKQIREFIADWLDKSDSFNVISAIKFRNGVTARKLYIKDLMALLKDWDNRNNKSWNKQN